MMSECVTVQQVPGQPRRRWFSDDFFDLIVWVAGDEILAFQLCYEIQNNERALSWNLEIGFAHYRVDAGENQPPYKASPVLIADGPFDRDRVAEEFARRSRSIDSIITSFIQSKLISFPGAG